ncbi:MAG: ubiquinone biosynthesis hydroxylase [Bauldia sp.]|nr:ubiquinone biosynthesis hydroxylase [Bauldia sp.]
MASENETDVVIAGGGHVGLSLALALRAAMPSLGVTLVDAAPPEAAARDTRASAIAAAGRRMLMRLGVWSEIAPDAQPINEMVITDSRTGDAVRPVFLTFDGKVEDGQPFAHMVTNASMIGALRRGAEAAGVAMLAPETVRDFTVGASGISVELGSGDAIRARLLVAADGVRSRLRSLAGISTVGWNYGQSGIVVTVAHERPHGGRAVEHFLPAGPFAMLPLPDNRSSLVWTERTETAERLVGGDADVFQYELERRFGHQLGAIQPLGKPRAFPLGLTLARSFVKPRLALCGDAAHGIHPIAGQGLNLGFRDVAALAETIVEAERLGLDIGSLAVLERYQSWRRFDTVEMGATTDILNRLFSNDNPLLRLGRDVGLGLVDRLPALKKMFIGQAAGTGGDLPRLLRGEAI